MESGNLLLIIIEAMAIGLSCGLIAAVYRCILAYEPIMSWWWRFGNRYENKWFFKPIWGCHKCIGGQFGLWSYLLLIVLPFFGSIHAQISILNAMWYDCIKIILSLIFGLLLSICSSIFSADKFCKIIDK